MASLAAGCSVAFVVSSAPSGAGTGPSTASRIHLRGAEGARSGPARLGAATAATAATAAGFVAAAVHRRRAQKALALRAKGERSQEASDSANSIAVPFLAVPAALSNDPLNTTYPGDVGFDPLGISADGYFTEVLENFGFKFDAMRWYREAELMHGRVAMLATFNVVLRCTPLAGIMPDPLLEQNSIWQFTQIMAMLEGFRGWRLLIDKDMIAGDLGLGAGPMQDGWKLRWDMTLEELASKQYKELQNGRLAMLAFAGIAAQYWVTGRPVGLPLEEMRRLEDMVGTVMLPSENPLQSSLMTLFGGLIVADGIRRLTPAGERKQQNSIAAKAINPSKLAFGLQAPPTSLPAGVVAGQPGQTLAVTEEQILQFEEDGVIMIKGGMKDWVPFLQAATDFQIEHPHVWSLVGRMSGMYDYIQRNMWMTNDGFRDFLYYSPLGHVLSQLGRTEEVRCSTDMLLVNPNRGFGWHQDNQNGPIDFPDAMRWWVAMDKCGEDDFGAPEYLLGSHRNKTVSDDAVFVNLDQGDLSSFRRKTKFIPEPGDLIVWNARTIHRIVAPPDQQWVEGTQRRAIGGTVAKAGAKYINKGGASGISDLAGHSQKNGEPLNSPYFPRIYPSTLPEEVQTRAEDKLVGRSPKKMVNLGVTLASNLGKYVSFTKVVGKKD